MVDPHSCQNEKDAKFIPIWFNHYMHTLPVVTVILEILFCVHEYPSKTTGIKAVLGFGVVYTAWVFLIANVSNFWVYPFMEKMNLPALACFFGGAYVLLVLLYLMGDWLAASKVPAYGGKHSMDKKIE